MNVLCWRTFGAIAALGLLGCTASNTGSPPPAPAGCGEDSSVQCAEGVGWSCNAGDNPESEQSGLSCSEPTADGPNDDFCCFEWTYGFELHPGRRSDFGVSAGLVRIPLRRGRRPQLARLFSQLQQSDSRRTG